MQYIELTLQNTLRSSPFWDVMQRRLVVSCRRFRTNYWPHIQRSISPENGTDGLSRNVGK
jgi:hypothetical protein